MECPSCNYHFCKTCLCSWLENGHWAADYFTHICTEVKLIEVAEVMENRAIALKELNRYQDTLEHWHDIYRDQHKTPGKLLTLQLAELKILAKKQVLQLSETSFITDVWLQIAECKRVFKWASVYDYYILANKDKNRRSLFDDLSRKGAFVMEHLFMSGFGFMRATFGKKGTEQEALRALTAGVTETCTGFCPADVYPSVKLLQLIGKGKFQKFTKESDRILDPIIEEHIERMKQGDEEGDMVDVLLKYHKDNVAESSDFSLTTDNIKGVILELLGGGSENSSATLEWTMAELLKNPRVMDKVQAEVRQVYHEQGSIDETKIHELKYLKLVVREALRLHPPVPLLVPRESMQRCQIHSYDFPPKTRVVINAWAIARDPEYWVEPETFNPERFEDSSVDYKGNHFELIPFGAGRRRCPGMTLGVANVELPLAMLLYHFNWKLPNGMLPQELDMDESYGLTMRRKNHLLAIPTLK